MIRLMKNPVQSSGTVWFQPPNKFRREVKGNSPSITVSDGRNLWIYYPNFKSAERYPLGKGSPLDATVAAINSALNLENIETSFNISATKSDNGHELALLPRTAAMKRVFKSLICESMTSSGSNAPTCSCRTAIGSLRRILTRLGRQFLRPRLNSSHLPARK